MSGINEESKRRFLTVYLPDTRGVTISRFGRGNLKIGLGVYTYSRVAGDPVKPSNPTDGTCPGSTPECEAICYAKRIGEPVLSVYRRNSHYDVPELPRDARLLRIHVSGDFDTVFYINHWIERLRERPDVIAWAYTRSWRVPELLPSLERLRALPNVQMFASMDASTKEIPPYGWRRAWIEGDPRLHSGKSEHNQVAIIGADFADLMIGTPSYVCPEETGRKPNCEACRYCFDGRQGDVTFLKH